MHRSFSHAFGDGLEPEIYHFGVSKPYYGVVDVGKVTYTVQGV